uniref:hemicentin-1-like n=1 Tax=Styela clava TaxID=7725 RepID=UPI001939629B|nr:hemicentin-1-like [Styela clava]
MYSIRIIVGLFCLIAFFVADSDQGECEDIQDWCGSVSASFCATTESMRTHCPKKCDVCPPPECDECQHNCTVKSDGKVECTCRKGFRLASDEISCDDIDECSENKTLCGDEVCRNYDGGYRCEPDKCAVFVSDGYILSHSYDNTCCKQTPGESCGQNAQNMLRDADGKPRKTPQRIIGGENATAGMWPWQVHIFLRTSLCGGSLINTLWVVSAAHCIASFGDVSKQRLQVRLGVLDTTNFQLPSIQTRRVTRIIQHEKYDFPKYDIALLRMNKAVVVSDLIKPICLPHGEIPPTGLKCFATGYGVTVVGGSAAKYLQQVDLPIVDTKVCKKAYEGEHDIVEDIMICAGYTEGGKDACQGDSGGPLMCQRCDSCDWFLAGVTSFGSGCGDAGYYGVYTKVEYFEQWIASKIKSVTIEKKTCAPIAWTEWGDWGRCTKKCGGGTQNRIRLCNGEIGKPGCIGDEIQSKPCNENPCDKDSWSRWGQCSKSCGSGEQSRTRICVTASCRETRQKRECNSQSCPVWGKWSKWGACSKKCDIGEQSRTRICINGDVGQLGCRGRTIQTQNCNEDPCPRWSGWSPYSKCPVTCGGGMQKSTRKCINGTPGKDCIGNAERERVCGTSDCSVSFSDWSRWTTCSKPCGGGTQTRSRSCPKENCTPDSFGSRTTQSRRCNSDGCDGEWTAWSPWDVCSTTCGPGTRKRIRTCHGGSKCPGNDFDNGECNLRDCTGEWTRWSDWSECSQTCDTGLRERTRTCENGGNCPGRARETESCMIRSCPVWSDWDAWSECSVTCDKGERARTRTCGRGSQDEGQCEGISREVEECDEGSCVGQCIGDCKAYVQVAACINNAAYMDHYCPKSCCGSECQDTWNECRNFDINSVCSESFYALQCLRTCGYCSS